MHALDELVRSAALGELAEETRILYVSPLKALSNDVRVNLEIPLAGIAELARAQGAPLPEIRVAVRTGDTPVAERALMTRKAPHIFVTTPESLFILLTAEKSRQMLRSVRTLIVDEIHAVAGSKRGSHLALSIARLEALAEGRVQKIGLSATVSPIEEVGRFLSERAHIIQVGRRRDMDIAVEVPRDELGAVASQRNVVGDLRPHGGAGRRSIAPRWFSSTRAGRPSAWRMRWASGWARATVLPHHGSLSRRLRLEAEQRLKRGELRAVVATASLELGIDIGTVDLVCQMGSPRSIAVALQRVGRAGHWVGAKPKGRIFATTRDELIECAAVVRSIKRGELDRLEIPRAPLDILAQQIVAMAACDDWGEDELFAFVRASLSLSRACHGGISMR